MLGEEGHKISASRRAYHHVKERILGGTLRGTELLSEGDVAEELGMSRTPVRAAFVQLEAEGFLRLYPKRGAIVTPVGAREAEAVIEARWVLERHAVERSTRELGAQLREIGDDRAFHRALVAATGNEILLSLYDSLRDRERRLGGAPSEQRAAENRDLAAALASGANDQALRILRRHLDGVLATLRNR